MNCIDLVNYGYDTSCCCASCHNDLDEFAVSYEDEWLGEMWFVCCGGDSFIQTKKAIEENKNG